MVLDEEPQETGLVKTLAKWSRMFQRLAAKARWHFFGILLWLVQRPQLRCFPTPWPSTSNPAAYHLQPGHPTASPQVFAELIRLRDRMGTSLAFLGTSVAVAIEITKPVKHVLEKAKLAAAIEDAKGIDLSNPRKSAQSLGIGPRGGMPSTKAELMKVAAALHLSTEGTLAELKTRCREGYAEWQTIMAGQARSPPGAPSSSSSLQDSLPHKSPPMGVMPKSQLPPKQPPPGTSGLGFPTWGPPPPGMRQQVDVVVTNVPGTPTEQSALSEEDYYLMSPDELMDTQ